MGRIVVGVDESAGAADALRWAVREAKVRDWSLTAVLAWGFLDQHHATVGAPFDPTYGEADAIAALESIVAATVGTAAAATIEQIVVNDLPAAALLDASDGADLLVVGARGLGPVRRLLLGSVSQACLHHATCPLAIVRDGTLDAGKRIARVVVGVDGSDTAGHALDWALEAGRLHQARVEVVHAWADPLRRGRTIRARRLRHRSAGGRRASHARCRCRRGRHQRVARPGHPHVGARQRRRRPCSRRPRTPTWWWSGRGASAGSRAWCSDRSATTSPTTRRAR